MLLILYLLLSKYASRYVSAHGDKLAGLGRGMRDAQKERGAPLGNLANVEAHFASMNLGTAVVANANVVRKAAEVLLREFLLGDDMVHHGTRHVVACHAMLGNALKEVALLATDKPLSCAAKRGVEHAYLLEELTAHGHISSARDTPLRK